MYIRDNEKNIYIVFSCVRSTKEPNKNICWVDWVDNNLSNDSLKFEIFNILSWLNLSHEFI